MATKEDKWFVGQLPVSSAYVGAKKVYPAGAPIGPASEYTIIHKKEGFTEGYLPYTLDRSPYRISRQLDADGNRIWLDGEPGGKYNLRTDTILIDAPKGSGLTFYSNNSAKYDWVEDVECLGHDELGNFAYIGYVDDGTTRNWWSCFDRPITLTAEKPSMEKFLYSSSSKRGTMGDLSTFTQNLTGQEWGNINQAFAYCDNIPEQDFARWIVSNDSGYPYGITEVEGDWGDWSNNWLSLNTTYPVVKTTDPSKVSWPKKKDFVGTPTNFVELGKWNSVGSSSQVREAGKIHFYYNDSNRYSYWDFSAIDADGTDHTELFANPPAGAWLSFRPLSNAYGGSWMNLMRKTINGYGNYSNSGTASSGQAYSKSLAAGLVVEVRLVYG